LSTSPRTASLRLPEPEPRDIADARRWAVGVLRRWQLDPLAEAVRLVVSELVSNSFEHAGTGCTVVLELHPACLRVEVHDGSPEGAPAVRDAGRLAPSGRGLAIVSALSRSFGSTRSGWGTVVWCEIDTSDPAELEGPPVGDAQERT
jgi:anti-sigma regulatory factor (Ser/Thr protein kinase)